MNNYKLDIVAKTLTITAAFEEKIQDPTSAEYNLFLKLTREIPGLTVLKKTHSTPRKYKTKNGEIFHCNQFKNLKYENMERFISGLPNSKEYMREYTIVRNNAAAPNTSQYAIVRRWFMEQFPEFRSNPIIYFDEAVKVLKAQSVIDEVNKERSSQPA